MRKFCFDLSFSILMFLFLIFAFSNIGFIFKLNINIYYALLSFLATLFYLFKRKNLKAALVLPLMIVLSLFFSMLFIDTSFDGRCYHFTLEKLFFYGFNPIYNNIKTFADSQNIYYNLLFASSYPNAIELLRGNFYLFLKTMEASKVVNFLLAFSSIFYSMYFLKRKLDNIKTIFLTLAIFSLSVLITEINTKMVDFSLYCFFIFQIFSLILINKNKKVKLNSCVFIISSIFSIATKYTGLFSTVIILFFNLIYKKDLKFLKTIAIIGFSSLILCFQPYITNIRNFHNPFYPSIGYNKQDFMTKQNPKEFQSKPYLYKFVRSMFSSVSDSRIGNPETPPIFWKIPFTFHYDMPYVAEEMRISGFGHLFSGIFLISLFLTVYLIYKKKGIFAFSIIFLTVFLNPICWWARFVPQLQLLPCFSCYYFRKKNFIFYPLAVLIILNGFFVFRENFMANGYKTYVMKSFYDNLYEKYSTKPLTIYKNKISQDEDDETILERLNEYGINYILVNKKDTSFKQIKTEATISKNYFIKY